MAKFTGTQGLEYCAKIFFKLKVKDQDEWSQSNFGVSARTFRRWCDKHNIKVTKTITKG